tara:strand:+ start:3250 stop:3864 length:615 start_codon:yes stop_codon:yes gene_type:complete
MDSRSHWENIYKNKKIDEVSWFEETPHESINLINKFSRNNHDKIIDVGSGKGFLADNLIKLNYTNITLLDISLNALNEVKHRLNNRNVSYIESNILDFRSEKKFDIWHDRAVFHFITNKKKVKEYISQCNKYLNKDGILIIGTFAEDGPQKCSGIKIKRYSISDLEEIFKVNFRLIEGYKNIHKTPFNTLQSFSYGVFQKITLN